MQALTLVLGIETKAEYDSLRSQWVLNGSKIWITNGDIADLFTVFAKVFDHHSGKHVTTAFLVDKKFGGVTTGPNEKMMGIECAHSVTVSFVDVKIPSSHILGEIGQGFKIAMSTLNYGRFMIGVAMNSIMKKLLNICFNHVTSRIQFGKKLIEFEDIQYKIATMSSLIYATETLIFYISGLIDATSRPFDLEVASLKIFSTESAWHICDETIQILGGRGYMKANYNNSYFFRTMKLKKS
uniref:Very long-chain specific acyl-CoA dehydrogenase, mitochondrial (Trinotate prediction) n=1 Tax=Myxobolus squamalis TaxID=59785 RepID=A0A6B2G053_MYXSQ